MSRPRKAMLPAVTGNTPQMRFTVVLLPEPLGPMRPTISPSRTAKSSPSTARTPPKYFESPLSSSISRTARPRRHEAAQHAHHALVDHPARPPIHHQQDEQAEGEIADVADVLLQPGKRDAELPFEIGREAHAEIRQAVDQHPLYKNHGEQRAEDAAEPAQDRIGDGERGRQH